MENSKDLFGPKREVKVSPHDMGKCANCNAQCCRYITVKIDKAKTKEEFDRIRWWFAHWNVAVEIRKNGQWFLRVDTPCKHLAPENWCRIYERRPSVCRNYICDSVKKDPRNKTELSFKSVADIEAYAIQMLAKGEQPESSPSPDQQDKPA